ncbi:MAG: cation:proton antiporter [Haloferacaceae archaeon]
MAVGLVEVGELFVALALSGAVASRLGVSVIPLYVLGGMAVSPHVAGRAGLPAVAPGEAVTLLADLGLVLLLFFLGLEFSLDRLLAARDRIVRAGLVDLGVNFPLGVGLGLLFGWGPLAALLLGGIVYVSSSAIVTKLLVDLGWIADAESEPVLGTLVFEDVAVAVYLAVVGSVVLGSGDAVGAARRVGVALGVLALLVVVVRYGGGLFDRALAAETEEAFVLRILALVVPVAGAALVLGVSEAVAAFFVGTAVGATDHVDRIERLASPLRDVFAAVFFLWIGLGTDPLVVARAALPVLAMVAVTAPSKVLSGYVGGRGYGLSERRSLRVGLGLVARGEFSLVVAALAAAGSGPVLTEVLPAVAVGYVLATSLLGTSLMQHAERFEWLVAGTG